MNITIHIDGGSRGNPGPAAVGVVIREQETQKPIIEAGYYLGVTTNNVAEYQGLLRALKLAVEMDAEDVHIHSDSELMVKQITGEYRVKSQDLAPLHTEAQRLLLKLGSWQIRHVKREANRRADELVNMALDAESDVMVLNALGGADANPPADRRPAPNNNGSGKAARQLKQADTASGPQQAISASEIPKWSATIEATAKGESRCPLGCALNRTFAFGPQTPKGFCVHAAAAMYLTDPFSLIEPVTTACGACGKAVRVEL